MMNGYMWSDFLRHESQCSDLLTFTFGRGFAYGEKLTKRILNVCSPESGKIRVVFRGHQHSEPFLWELIYRRGFYAVWDGCVKFESSGQELEIPNEVSVYTLISCPASGLLFSMDSVVEVDIKTFDNWILRHKFFKIPSKQSA